MSIINQSFNIFSLEKDFDQPSARKWLEENWTVTFYISSIYCLTIFGIKYLMQSKSKFDLTGLLFLWNLFLAGFSILGTIRVLPELLDLLSQPNGLRLSVCYPLNQHSNAWAFWFYAFVASKVLELGDTVFVVLRKNPLMFLHWYHHITVLIYCWYTYSQYASHSRWFTAMNFFVHSIMYSYYALKAVGVKVSKPVAASITSLQIVQMAVGMFVNLYAMRTKLAGEDCDMPLENTVWSLVMYTSYFALFAQFFAKAYLKKGVKGVTKNKQI